MPSTCSTETSAGRSCPTDSRSQRRNPTRTAPSAVVINSAADSIISRSPLSIRGRPTQPSLPEGGPDQPARRGSLRGATDRSRKQSRPRQSPPSTRQPQPKPRSCPDAATDRRSSCKTLPNRPPDIQPATIQPRMSVTDEVIEAEKQGYRGRRQRRLLWSLALSPHCPYIAPDSP